MAFRFKCQKMPKCPPGVLVTEPKVDTTDYSLTGFNFTITNYPANFFATTASQVVPQSVKRSKWLAMINPLTLAPHLFFPDFETGQPVIVRYFAYRTGAPNFATSGAIATLTAEYDGPLVTRRIFFDAIGAHAACTIYLYEWFGLAPLTIKPAES